MKKTATANLFLVGAMKAGTTSLSDMLARHRAVFFSPVKEPNFFTEHLPAAIYDPSPFFSIDNYFKSKFPERLHIAHLKNRSHYDELFSLAEPQHIYLAEASTSYLHAPEAALNIYNYNKDAKIIILTRDRLSRAFSHYNMDLDLGREKRSFEEVMRQNISDYEKGNLSCWSYLGMSLYSDNIKRFKELFGPNVLILDFGRLLKEEPIKNSLFQFLNLKDENILIEHKNQSSNIANPTLLYYLKKSGLKPILSLFFSSRIRQMLFRKLATKTGKSKIELPDEVHRKLTDIFNADASQMKDHVFA